MSAVTPRPPDDAEAMHAARALSAAVALLSRAAGRALAPWDMTWPQAMSLLLLRAEDEPTNATRLVERLGLGRTAMTAVVDRLERRGWVERHAHPRDRRVALVQLTDQGRDVAEQAAVALQHALEPLIKQAGLPDPPDHIARSLIARLQSGDSAAG